MGRYLNPKSDIVFKKIFYDHPNLLISFLNAVLPLSNDWYHHYSMVKVNNPKQEIIKGLTLVFVELSKFPVKTYHEKKLRVLWLRFLNELGEM